MAKKIAMVLSGCGFKDGAEITEAVSAIICINQLGAEITFFAPNIEVKVQNFLTGEPSTEPRNIMVESSRITRAKINDLSTLVTNDFDALVMPGGFGVALHLSTWATKGAQCEVLPNLKKIIEEFHQQSKPIGAICIAPAIVAKVLGHHGVTVTLGSSVEVHQEIAKTGALTENCPTRDFITDRLHKIITTPAYMDEAAAPADVFTGIQGLAKELVEMA